MSAQEMLVLKGLPASGKTTAAKALVAAEPEQWVRINWDDLRYSEPDWRFTRKREEAMKERSYQLARKAFAQGKSVIVDNTNLSEKAVGKWARIAKECGAGLRFQSFLDVPVRECVRRDAERTGRAHVGRYVIERMALFNDLISFPPDKKLVLVDMDGTLSDCEHRRRFVQQKPKDWRSFYRGCLDDPPVQFVLDWVHALCADPTFAVCIVSGRPLDEAGDQTVRWLARHSVQYEHLFMRNGGDYDQDFIVKQAILDKLPKDQIALVLDDRNQVVDMWRRNGLRVIQVAEGDF